MRRISLVVLMLALVATSSAQTKRARRHKEPAAPQMPSAKQSEEMKKMTDTFAGMWKTTATMEKNPLFPQGGTATGRSDFRSGPAGNSLVERARSHGAMGAFAGLGLIWWDAKTAAYSGVWCDSLAPGGCDSLGQGQWQGNDLVFTSTQDTGQNKLHYRETYSAITADSFTYTVETATDDGAMTKFMTIQYERVQPRTTVVTPPAAPENPAASPQSAPAPESTPPKPN